MKVKHSEIEIDSKNPFSNCKLDRQKYSVVLTNIIKSYPSGFVLALNNKWGTGKTTFVRMWEQDLKNNDYKTLNFNAWENDFDNSPLTALMGELKTLTTTETKPAFQKTLKTAAILTKHIAPIIVKSIADKYINTDGIKEAILGVTDGFTEIFENEVNQYQEKKKSIQDFRENLSEFIRKTNDGRPLIFIIDELDRCRPNYAVSILEQIKHFFSIPYIVFILSIDKEQLGNAIKGVYGSDLINSDEYLRRFIDFEYSIPEPEDDKFYKYLYDYFKFDDFFNAPERIKHYELKSDKSDFLDTCKVLLSNSKVPLRQQEKIFAHARLALRSFNTNMYVMPQIFLLLIFIKVKDNKFYENLKSKSFSILEVQNNFIGLIDNITNKNINLLMWLEGSLINTYNNHILEAYDRDNLLEKDDLDTGKDRLIISSIFKEKSAGEFMNILEHIKNDRSKGRLSLTHFTNRIDLLDNIKI